MFLIYTIDKILAKPRNVFNLNLNNYEKFWIGKKAVTLTRGERRLRAGSGASRLDISSISKPN